MARDALGRDELERADELAAGGEGFLALDLRDAEVGEDDPAVGAEQHVGGLHVPVHDPDGVRGVQRADDREPDARGVGGLEGPALQYVVQRLAPDQLHDDPGQSVLDDHGVDGDGGRMVDPCGGAGLAVQTMGRPLVGVVRRIPSPGNRDCLTATSR